MRIGIRQHKNSLRRELILFVFFVFLGQCCGFVQAEGHEDLAAAVAETTPTIEDNAPRGKGFTEAGFIRVYYLGLLGVSQNSNKVCELAGFGEDSICNQLSGTSASGDRCAQIQDETMRNFCSALEKTNPTLCPHSTDYAESSCKAIVLNDPGLCKLYGTTDAISCTNNVYVNRALNQRDASWCEYIQGDIIAYFVCKGISETK